VALFLLTYLVQVAISLRHHSGLVLPWDMIPRWREFDAIDYTNIAVYGYNSLYRSAYFPLYPSYVALVNLLFLGRQPVLAALIVNNVGALIGSIGLAFLAVRESKRYEVARWTLLAFFAYPLAFFLAAPYSEGLFLASFAWCLWATRERIWWLAALLSFTAALTRLTGIVLVIPMLIEFFRAMDWGKRINLRDIPTRVLSGVLLVIAVPLAIGLFMLYLSKTIGDPLGFYHAQVYFGHSTLFYPVGLVEGIHFYLSRPFLSFTQMRQMIDFLPLLGLTAIAVIAARKQPLAYTVLVLELFVLATQSPKIYSPGNAVFVSAGRYMLMALPSFLIIGGWFAQNRKLGLLCCVVSFLVQIVFAVYFLQGGAII
jgi:Gpi18-like mannosyltransferase